MNRIVRKNKTDSMDKCKVEILHLSCGGYIPLKSSIECIYTPTMYSGIPTESNRYLNFLKYDYLPLRERDSFGRPTNW